MRCWAIDERHAASPSQSASATRRCNGSRSVASTRPPAVKVALAEQHPYAVRPVLDGSDLRAGAHIDPEGREVLAERAPEGGVVVVGGHVEEQSLGRAGEVRVEHRDELATGEVTRVCEEAAGEDLEGEVTPAGGNGAGRGRRLRSPRRRRHTSGEAHVEQAERGADVDVAAR